MSPHERLEENFSRWAGVENVVACSSGTAALHLALEALQLPQGSEIILPNLTMVACARAVILAGLTPVFAGCYDDLLVSPDYIERAVTSKTRAIMAVHIYGRHCDMKRIIEIATANDLVVIEDLAEGHGISPHPSTDASCWSFYKNKIIFGEEGGAVAFKDRQAAVLARQLRSLGFTPQHDFDHVPRGHNYRLADSLARIIDDNLEFAHSFLLWRRKIEGWYDEVCPEYWKMPKRDVVWVYDIRIPNLNQQTQDILVTVLKEKGIQARHCFKPMSSLKEFQDCRCVTIKREHRLAQEVIYLPVQPVLTTKETIRETFDLIKSVVS